MNTFKFIKNGLLLSVGFLSFTGCVQNDDFSVPPIVCNQKWNANTQISAIKALNDTDTPLEITENLILEGYVVSSDETGNFFKTISIQDKAENPTTGMSIELDLANTYTNFPVGSKILVNAKGLFVAKDRGSYKIGTKFTDAKGTERVGRMAEVDALKKVAMSCEEKVQIKPTKFTSIEQALNEANINTLITLENVQFEKAGNGETYYEEGGKDTFGGATNRKIVDSEGNTLVLRTSSFADFAAEKLPTGNGSITAVLSAYANNNRVTKSTYQLFIRSVEDVKMEGERVEKIEGAGAIGGSAAKHVTSLNENFENYAERQNNFPEFINFAYNGKRYWELRKHGDNQYIQFSSFKSGEKNEAFFIVPVNFDAASEFSFKTKDGHYNGDALSIYYVPNYEINGNLKKSDFVDITSSFKLAKGTSQGYADNFVASGVYDLKSLKGKGAIIFAYNGQDGGVTSTFQIDDIIIK